MPHARDEATADVQAPQPGSRDDGGGRESLVSLVIGGGLDRARKEKPDRGMQQRARTPARLADPTTLGRTRSRVEAAQVRVRVRARVRVRVRVRIATHAFGPCLGIALGSLRCASSSSAPASTSSRRLRSRCCSVLHSSFWRRRSGAKSKV